jgi:hypothetical protein
MAQAFRKTCKTSQRTTLRFHIQMAIRINAASQLDHFFFAIDDFDTLVLQPRNQQMKTVGAEVNSGKIGRIQLISHMQPWYNYMWSLK